MNAHTTSARLRFMAISAGVERCPMCQREQDSADHIFGRCGTVRRAKALILASPSYQSTCGFRELTLAEHHLDGVADGQMAQAILALNSAILRTRWLSQKEQFANIDDAANHICDLFFAPGIGESRISKSRRERRRSRLQAPPDRTGYVLYRTDGVARGQGRGRQRGPSRCGRGAVCFGLRHAVSAQALEA